MTPSAFLTALCWQLTLAGVPHVSSDVAAFVESVWPLTEDDPDVSRWAREHAERHEGVEAGG